MMVGMMSTPVADPEWIRALTGLIPVLAAAIGSLAAAIVGMRRQHRSLVREVRETRHEITNDHEKNLRVDLDDRFEAVMEDLRQTRLSVSELRDSLDAATLVQAEAARGLRHSIEALADRSKAEEALIRQDSARATADLEMRLARIEESL